MPVVRFRIGEEELKKINEKADLCAVNRSEYIRQMSMHGSIRSKLDKEATRQLFLLQADVGRLGGLFKLWLSRAEDSSMHEQLDIYRLVFEIEQLKKSINKLITKL